MNMSVIHESIITKLNQHIPVPLMGRHHSRYYKRMTCALTEVERPHQSKLINIIK